MRRFLARWGAPGRAETAELLASELVTNALVHTDGGAVVKAAFTGAAGTAFTGTAGRAKGRLRVEVRDFMAGHPALGGPGTDIGPPVGDVVPEMNDIEKAATSGRGLLLVHALSDGWGVRAHGVGKSVWFELAAQEP
ncbi:ATP-binding protein [Streptomyces rectiverticillatus]|uniref:ATP-binding protein n=1 Tax=Streptomyces rectiverticillatus TaxID=173860 RepID=UPI0031B64BB9